MKIWSKVNEVKLNIKRCFMFWRGLCLCVPVLTQATLTVIFCARCHVYGPTSVLKCGKKKKA